MDEILKQITSKYIGVSYHANRGKWQVKIRSNGKQKHLGYFEDEEEAARAYNRAARAVHLNPKLNAMPEETRTMFPHYPNEHQRLRKHRRTLLDARIQNMKRGSLLKPDVPGELRSVNRFIW